MKVKSTLTANAAFLATAFAVGLLAAVPTQAQTFSVVHNFTGGSDGQYSVSNLVVNQGKLYGTTLYGGSNGNGVVYEVTP